MNQRVIRPGEQPDTDVRVIVTELLNTRRKMMGNQVRIGAHNEGTAPFGIVHLGLEGIDGGDNRSHQF